LRIVLVVEGGLEEDGTIREERMAKWSEKEGETVQ